MPSGLTLHSRQRRPTISLALESVLEIVKLTEKISKQLVVRILLQRVMHQTESHYKLPGMLLTKIFLGRRKLRQLSQIMMSAEIETHDILNLAIHHLRDMEVI